MSDAAFVSVLMCTRNRPQDIGWALPAVLQNTYPHYEVVVVDQSDDAQTADLVRPLMDAHPRLRYIPTETRGLSRARNIAIAQARGELIAFTDDDCEPPAEWVERIAALFAENATLDLVYGQVHQPEALPPNVVVPCLYFDTGRRLLPGDILGMGANMAFRRSLPEKIGGYDELLGAGGPFGGGEDFDFSYRAQRAGAKVSVDPTLVLTHRSYRSGDEWGRVMEAYGKGDAAFHGKYVRLGDGWAWGQVAQNIFHRVVRGVAKRILGRPAHELSYLRGYRAGFAASRAFPVDRATQLYVLPPAAPAVSACTPEGIAIR